MDVGILGQMGIAGDRAESSANARKKDKTMKISELPDGPAPWAPLATREIEQYDAAMEGIEPQAESSAKKEEAHVRAMAELSVQNRGLKRTFCDRAVEPVRDVKRLRSDVSGTAPMF